MLNRYELAHLNDWDGNSIKINDNEGYILAPQMGAGRKENDNSFTGVLMGEVKKSNYSNVGLFGYSDGQRSFFLNSENGSTILGSKKNSQIIMDPSASRALIYSSNFWKDSSYNEQTGLPNFDTTDSFYKNYRKDNFEAKTDDTDKATGQGLLIDLTTPQIYAGHGHFYLTNTDGRIAGWAFSNHTLFSVPSDKGSNAYDGIVMTTSPRYDDPNDKEKGGDLVGRIFLGRHNNFKSTQPGFCLSQRGLSIGSKVRISANGTAEFGKLDGRHWIISHGGTNSYIAYMKTYGNNHTQPIQFHSGSSSGLQKIGIGQYNENGEEIKEDVVEVYIGTNGISLGRRFSVDAAGNLRAYTGKIGGWTIDGSTLSARNIIIDSNGSIRHQNGDTSNWSINSGGSAYFTNVTALNGRIGDNNVLKGSGFNFGGSSSTLYPGKLGAAGGSYGSGIGNTKTLGGYLYSKYKAKFDEIYAGIAVVGKLEAHQGVLGKLSTFNGRVAVNGHTLDRASSGNWYVDINGTHYPLKGSDYIWGSRD